jgi:hypothetical protein
MRTGNKTEQNADLIQSTHDTTGATTIDANMPSIGK